MGFGRAWIRGLLSAAGVAVLVPLGLIVAVVLAATISGGGIGGLGQIVGGPALPGSDPVADALSSASRAGRVPAVPARDRRAAAGGGASPSSRPGGGQRPQGERPPSQDDTRRPSGGQRPSTPSPVATPPPRPVPTPAPTPVPAPAPGGSPVEDVVAGAGTVVDSAVRPVPGAGPPAADAVGTVIGLLAPSRPAPPEAAPAPAAPVSLP
ncbi:hypothetical protein [Paraconexibacter sp.]|uniref:hypothetical protein n=1 Tax=Paraconexibacter sp. TaxID=2949640 RepID=UPI003561438C